MPVVPPLSGIGASPELITRVTVYTPSVLYVIACGPFVLAVCSFPKFQLNVTGACSITLLFGLDAVVLVKRIVDPAQTLIVPFTAAGIEVKLVDV